MSVESRTWEAAVRWLKAKPEHAEIVRACFYDDPLIAAAERYHASSEWRAVRGFIGPRIGVALDIGAGRGISSYALARDGWQVTALEPDPSSIVGAGAIRDLTGQTGLSIRVVEDWGEALPFADGTFDLVHGRQVLHHARHLPAFCNEVARVLKPGGIFIATREHVIFRAGDLDKFLAKHLLHPLYGGENAFPLEEYKRAIESAGIRLTTVLNPWASDINLFPQTVEDVGARIRRMMPIAPAFVFTPSIVRFLGQFVRTPGAAYSFVGIKGDSERHRRGGGVRTEEVRCKEVPMSKRCRQGNAR